jgi:hypothetical protein
MLKPVLPEGYWNSERIELFWHYVEWFLAENQIWLMMIVALFLAAGIIGVIASLFQRRNNDDDDDEYEVRRL